MKLVADDVQTWIFGVYPKGLLDPVASYTKPGYWFADAYKKGLWDGVYRLVQYDRRRRQHWFPTGLIDPVLVHLAKIGHHHTFVDNRSTEVCENPVYELHDDAAGSICLNKGKYDFQAAAVDSALIRARGIVKIACNGGKTEIGAAIIKSLGRSTIWFTHRKHLLYQTRERLSERLQQPIGIIGDGKCEYEDVTVGMVQTCGFRQHDAFLGKCQVIIGDEVHHLQSNQWYENFKAVPAPWRYGLTATPPNLSEEGMLLRAMTGPILCAISSQELIDRGVSVPPKVWIADCDKPALGSSMDWKKVYDIGIVENPNRNEMIAKVCDQFRRDRKPTLVLVHRIKHGQLLDQLLSRHGIRCAFIQGSVPQSRREQWLQYLWEGEFDAIVAVATTLGEGANFPQLSAIVNATGTRGGGDAREDAETGRSTIQILGRGLRNYEGKTHVDYVDFADLGNKSLKKASLARLGTLKDEGYGQYIERWENYRP